MRVLEIITNVLAVILIFFCLVDIIVPSIRLRRGLPHKIENQATISEEFKKALVKIGFNIAGVVSLILFLLIY